MSRAFPHFAVTGAALAGFLCLGAQAAPRSQVAKSDQGTKILVYDSLCDEDNALECMTAEIGCDAPGEFVASVFGLSAQDAASVFAKGNGKGSVSAGAVGRPLQVSRVSLSQFTYKWDVSLLSFDKPNEAWGIVWNSAEIQLQAGARKIALRRGELGESALREVVSICAAAPR